MNIKYFFFALALFLAPIFKSEAQFLTIQHDGMARSYMTGVPSNYDSTISYPLILNLHGWTQTALQQRMYSSFDAIMDTAAFILAYPEGLNLGGGLSWNAGTGANPTIDDVGFLNNLIDTISVDYNIDASRIYVCGMSMGGFMTQRLACELSHRIAAAASVTGMMPTNVASTCSPLRPVPVMHIHGTADPTVNYNGDNYVLSVDATIDLWNQHNNCDLNYTYTAIPDLDSTDQSTVEKYHYEGGDNNSEVVLFKVNGGGHSWPGGLPLVNVVTNYDIVATHEIWRFFRQHQMSELTGFPHIKDHENYAVINQFESRTLVVKSESGQLVKASVYDAVGKEILHVTETTPFNINYSEYSAGIYFIKINNWSEKFVVK